MFLLILFCWQCWCASGKDDVQITMKNYLDINSTSNVTFTLTEEISNTTYPFSSIKYSEEYSVALSNKEVFLWGVSYTVNNAAMVHKLPKQPAMKYDGQSNITVTVYGSLNNSKAFFQLDSKSTSQVRLGIDKAQVEFVNQCPYPVNYSELSDNCYKCLSKPLGTVNPGEVVVAAVSTHFTMTFSFDSVINVCRSVSFHFEEHKHYRINIISSNRSTEHSCIVEEIEQGKKPPNSYMPILYIGIILLGPFLIWTAGTQGYMILKKKGLLHCRRIDRKFSKDMGDPSTVQNEYGAVNKSEKDQLLASSTEISAQSQVNKPATKTKRLKSLDTVRGLSLMIMIFVNYGGGGYWFFAHSRWNGITVADLVFPWFVWIMGVSIVFSFRGRRKDSFMLSLYQIVRRTVILMSLGLFLNNDILAVPWFIWEVGLSITVPFRLMSRASPAYRCYKASIIILWVGIWFSSGFVLSKWRIPGVLQRFAATYFVVALTELLALPAHNILYSKLHSVFSKSQYFQDLLKNWIQWVAIFVLEAIWLLLTFGLNVPGCPRGYLGPGGLSEEGKYKNCTGGAAGYIDQWLLGKAHIYQHPTCKELYETGAYEPEGVLGTLNSIVICFLGVQGGRIIICYQSHTSRLLRFVLWGVVLGGIATALCEGQKNEGLIPLNKNLWSLSFILAMAGLGFILLTVFYFLIDVLEIWNGAPFVYPGMNSILVYVGSELLEGRFPFGWSGMENSHLELLASNVVSVLLWGMIAYYWYTIEFFVKI